MAGEMIETFARLIMTEASALGGRVWEEVPTRKTEGSEHALATELSNAAGHAYLALVMNYLDRTGSSHLSQAIMCHYQDYLKLVYPGGFLSRGRKQRRDIAGHLRLFCKALPGADQADGLEEGILTAIETSLAAPLPPGLAEKTASLVVQKARETKERFESLPP